MPTGSYCRISFGGRSSYFARIMRCVFEILARQSFQGRRGPRSTREHRENEWIVSLFELDLASRPFSHPQQYGLPSYWLSPGPVLIESAPIVWRKTGSLKVIASIGKSIWLEPTAPMSGRRRKIVKECRSKAREQDVERALGQLGAAGVGRPNRAGASCSASARARRISELVCPRRALGRPRRRGRQDPD